MKLPVIKLLRNWIYQKVKKEKIYLKIIRKEQRKYYKNSYLREIIEIVAKLNSDEEQLIHKKGTDQICLQIYLKK